MKECPTLDFRRIDESAHYGRICMVREGWGVMDIVTIDWMAYLDKQSNLI